MKQEIFIEITFFFDVIFWGHYGGNTTAFVHRGLPDQHNMKVSCSIFAFIGKEKSDQGIKFAQLLLGHRAKWSRT